MLAWKISKGLAMKASTLSAGKVLVWSQPKITSREFELRDGPELLATLKWHSVIGSLATGEAAGGSWTFKRAGFLRPRVLIRVAGGTEQSAQYEAGWAGGGRLLFPDGHGYYWRQRSFWRNEWAFEDERSGIVAQFNADLFIFKKTVQLRIGAIKHDESDRPLLALLGLYLMILSNDDAVTSTVV